MSLIILSFIAIIAIWRYSVTGDYYIEFDGNRYFVWQKDFAGYNNLRGTRGTEEEARKLVSELKINPPKVIKP